MLLWQLGVLPRPLSLSLTLLKECHSLAGSSGPASQECPQHGLASFEPAVPASPSQRRGAVVMDMACTELLFPVSPHQCR